MKLLLSVRSRTAIGRFRGGLSSVRPDDMAGLVIADAVRRARIDPSHVDEVFYGVLIKRAKTIATSPVWVHSWADYHSLCQASR